MSLAAERDQLSRRGQVGIISGPKNMATAFVILRCFLHDDASGSSICEGRASIREQRLSVHWSDATLDVIASLLRPVAYLSAVRDERNVGFDSSTGADVTPSIGPFVVPPNTFSFIG